MSVITFLALRLTPGDPAALILGPQAANKQNAELLVHLRQQMGLDKPLIVQYWIWLEQVLRGDFGTSNQSGNPVLGTVLNSIAPTAWLIGLSVVIAVPVSVVLGTTVANTRSKLLNGVLRTMTRLAVATPGFWVGLVLIIIFSVTLQLLPSTGYVSPIESVLEFVTHMVLPVLTLSIYLIGILTRFIYDETRNVQSQEYTRTAVAMGLSTTRIKWVYVLRNAILPAITVVGVQMGALTGGAVLAEQVFGLGGVGQLMLQGVLNRDYPVVQGAVLLLTTGVVLCTTAADLIRVAADPRSR